GRVGWLRVGPTCASSAPRIRPFASCPRAVSRGRWTRRWRGWSAPWRATVPAMAENITAGATRVPHPSAQSVSPGEPMYPHLLSPLKLGSLMLPNRVFMAPLTRSRAGQPGDVPTAMNAEYYAQRADAGLIVSEATPISPQGTGYAWTPGIHSDAQEA